MRIGANVRPQGLKRGVSTKAFYKQIGYKDQHGPDVRDVVGTLTLSVTQRDELAFLAAVREFFCSEGAGSLVITLDGKELASMKREAGDPDLGCDTCDVSEDGHEQDCPNAQE